MATSLKRSADEDPEELPPTKKPRLVRRAPPPTSAELAISSRKLQIGLSIHPKRPVDNLWDAMTEDFRLKAQHYAHLMLAREYEEKYGYSKVLNAMMSFGKCTCTNKPDCNEHHPRNVLINWRYKVGLFFFLFYRVKKTD